MKTSRKLLTLAAAMFAFAAIMAPQTAMALTAPCTPINNQADLAYTVGGVVQTEIKSDNDADELNGINPTSFNVGVKIDVLVDNKDGGNVGVTPGSLAKVLIFTVTNQGNSIQDYNLSHILADDLTVSNTAATDSFSLRLAGPDAALPEDAAGSTVAIYLENGATVGFQSGQDTDITVSPVIDNLDPTITYPIETTAGTRTVYIVYTPAALTAANEQVSVSYLKATTLWANGASLAAVLTDGDYTNDTFSVTSVMAPNGVCAAAPGGTSIDVVVGDGDGDIGEVVDTNDGDRDGAHLDKGAFIVETAKIDILKSYTVFSDGINDCTVAEPCQEIPGAVIEYTLAITNSGDASAVLGNFDDELNTNFTLITAAPAWTKPAGRTATTAAALTAELLDANGDGLSYSVTAGVTTVRFNMAELLDGGEAAYTLGNGELKAGETVTVKFRATIN